MCSDFEACGLKKRGLTRSDCNKIKDDPITCNNPLTHTRSHTTVVVLQYVERYSLFVVPVINCADWGVWICTFF